MTKYVLASQLDWSCATPLPVIEEESRFDPDTNTYHIQHTIKDKKNGMRAFFTPIMEATKSHQDVQLDAHGEEHYAAYTAKYAPKFSDSLYEELLNDDADANSVAASVLSRYHPGVPEMMLQLFGSLFHQWHISTHSRGKKTFIVPSPLNDPQPKEIHLYMKSTWRYDNMCLLEFRRKSTEEGKIAPWIKEAWKHQNHPETLEKFANEVCTDGEKVIACAMGSRLKDQFYGQWMMLNIPFRHYEELLRNDILEKIPDTDKFLAHCILSQRPQAKQMWSTPTTVQDDMKIEGCSQYHRTMVLNHIRSQRELIYQYMAGNLKKTTQQENQQPNTPISSIHHLKIRNHYALAIWWGAKTVEGRIWNGQMKNIKVGDRIHFGTLQVDVTQIQTYNSFRTMLTDVGYEKALPDVQNLEQAVQKYYSFKDYKTLEQTTE